MKDNDNIHVIISVGVEKHLIQLNILSFYIFSARAQKEHTYRIKAIYDKPRANIILNEERLKVFPLRPGKIQGCSPSPVLFNAELEILARERNNATQIRKKKVKLSFCI